MPKTTGMAKWSPSPRFPTRLPSLETQAERHLKQTRVVLLRSNLAEGVVGGRRLPAIGGSELNAVEQVERLHPELHIHLFRDGGPFEQSEVVVPYSRAKLRIGSRFAA